MALVFPSELAVEQVAFHLVTQMNLIYMDLSRPFPFGCLAKGSALRDLPLTCFQSSLAACLWLLTHSTPLPSLAAPSLPSIQDPLAQQPHLLAAFSVSKHLCDAGLPLELAAPL